MKALYRPLWTLALSSLLPLASRAEEPIPSCDDLSRWIPGDVVACAKVHDLERHLEAFLGSSLRRELEATAAGRFLKEDDRYREFVQAVEWVRRASGREPVEMAGEVFGQEIAAGVRLTFVGVPELIVLSRAKSRKSLEDARKTLERTFQEKSGHLPLAERSEFQGVAIEKLDKLHFAFLGNVLALANSRRVLEDAISLARGVPGPSPAAHELLRKASAGSAGRPFAAVAVRPRFVPGFDPPERADEAAGSILIGGILGALDASALLGARLELEGDGASLELVSVPEEGRPVQAVEAFFPAVAATDLEERLERRGVLASLSLHRDLALWWDRAEDLLEPQAAGKLENFASGASLFLGGLHFRDEFLPLLGRKVLLLVRNAEAEEGRLAPLPDVPGFALVFELEDPEKLARPLEAGFNGLVSIVNLERMRKKKDQPAMLVRHVKVGETDCLTVDLGLPPPGGARPGIEHNFTPSMAVAGTRVVLSSRFDLLRVVLEELERTKAPPGAASPSPARDRFLLDARPLLDLARSNLDFLVSQRMVEKGLPLERARGEVEAVLELLAFLRDVEVGLRNDGGVVRLEARLRVQADGARPKALEARAAAEEVER